MEVSNSIFSSRFKDFTQGNAVLLYMYELFLRFDLLASAGGDMPAGTEHSSDASRSVQEPLPRKKRPRSGTPQLEDWATLLRQNASRPIQMHRSADDERLVFFTAERMKLALVAERSNVSAARQTELEVVLKSMQTYRQTGQSVPDWLLKKQARLESELEDMETVPTFNSTPTIAPPPPLAARHNELSESDGATRALSSASESFS